MNSEKSRLQKPRFFGDRMATARRRSRTSLINEAIDIYLDHHRDLVEQKNLTGRDVSL